MLNARFISDTLLEVKEAMHSSKSTKMTFWYYDLERNLVSSKGEVNETPTRPMRDSQVSWVHKYHIPLAHRQAEEAKQAEARQAEFDAERAESEEYCRRIKELDKRMVLWESQNPIRGLSEEEADQVELKGDAFRDLLKRELRLYNYRHQTGA